jgi:hypothetical protein
MDASVLSFVDLIRDIVLAVFAVSTWYIAREEKRARILFDLSLTTDNIAFKNLSEIIIELRDKAGIKKRLEGHINTQDVNRLESKIDRLRDWDNIRNMSVAIFALSVAIELAVFAYSALSHS